MLLVNGSNSREVNNNKKKNIRSAKRRKLTKLCNIKITQISQTILNKKTKENSILTLNYISYAHIFTQLSTPFCNNLTYPLMFRKQKETKQKIKLNKKRSRFIINYIVKPYENLDDIQYKIKASKRDAKQICAVGEAEL